MTLMKDAVNTSLGLLHNDDEVSIWDFSSELNGEALPYRVLAPPALLGSSRASSQALVSGLEPAGNTALYATVRAAVEQLRGPQYDPKRINAVVVLSDGANEYMKDDDLDRLTADLSASDDRSRIRVFPVAYGPDSDAGPLDAIAHATTTGTAYRATDPRTIDKVLRSVVSNF
jgi:Ca-activated chloride channel family protein